MYVGNHSASYKKISKRAFKENGYTSFSLKVPYRILFWYFNKYVG